MEIKILCDCGTKFAFDVEPVHGRMPVAIQCPQCSIDVTAKANEIIASKMPAAVPVAVPVAMPISQPQAGPVAVPPAGRLKVSGVAHAAPAAAPVAVPVEQGMVPGLVMCPKHPRNEVASNCFVCQKPICTECMSLFGYLCSVQCKYQAEQRGIRVPQYEFQKTAVENRYWQKTGRIGAGIAFAFLLLLSGIVWYLYSGSQPKVLFSMKFSGDKGPLHAEFLDSDRVVGLFYDRLVVYDLKNKKEAWVAQLGANASEPAAKEGDGEEAVGQEGEPNAAKEVAAKIIARFRSSYDAPRMHLAKNEIWIMRGKKAISFDPKTGSVLKTIELPGEMSHFTSDDNGLFVFIETDRKSLITSIPFGGGEHKTIETSSTQTEMAQVAAKYPDNIDPTAAFLLNRELQEGGKAREKAYTDFYTAGTDVVRMDVKMLEERFVMKEAMKKAGPSKINSNTSAASPVGLVAEEIFNDIKRSSTGGVKEVNESRYSLTLRHLANSELQPLTIEIVGEPKFYSLKTVNLVVGGQTGVVLDKQNKKLFEVKLTYPVAEMLPDDVRHTPFFELNNVLYLADQGVLSALELPSGNVRWRLTSVGISRIQADKDGDLYVNTTTASPESIQYSEQIQIDDPTKQILMKVESKTGKVLWKSNNLHDCEISEKYLYAMNSQGGGFGMVRGLGEAVGSSMDDDSHFRIFRVNEDSGSRMWEYYNAGTPENVDFEGRKILLQFGNEIRVLKYLAF